MDKAKDPLPSDTRTMAQVLEILGARVEFRGHASKIDTSSVTSVEAPYDNALRDGRLVLAAVRDS